MLGAILTAVLRIIALISGVDTLVNIINGNTSQAASETTKFLIQTNTNTTVNDLSDPTFGLAKIASNEASILAAIATARSDILTAIASTQQSGSPVTLPPTPPSGFLSDAGTQVWSYPLAYGSPPTQAAGTLLSNIVLLTHNTAQMSDLTLSNGRFVKLRGRIMEQLYGSLLGSVPSPSIANVRPTDSVGSWLNREWGVYTWTQEGDGSWVATDHSLPYPADWVCTLTDAELHLLATGAVTTLPGGTGTAPVWPGLANVTLGTPLALVDGLTVPGPLHGVIVHVTAVSYPVSFYPFGSLKSFVKIGGIVFVDDNGQGELAQPLGLEQDVICPQTMAEAAHALIRLKSGTTGTITPWL